MPLQGSLPAPQAFVRHQHKRSQPGDLLTTASQYFMDETSKSSPASAALPAAPVEPGPDGQAKPLQQCVACFT